MNLIELKQLFEQADLNGSLTAAEARNSIHDLSATVKTHLLFGCFERSGLSQRKFGQEISNNGLNSFQNSMADCRGGKMYKDSHFSFDNLEGLATKGKNGLNAHLLTLEAIMETADLYSVGFSFDRIDEFVKFIYELYEVISKNIISHIKTY